MTEIQFIHCADLHIGTNRWKNPERKQDFIDSFEHLANYAIEKKVDFIIAPSHTTFVYTVEIVFFGIMVSPTHRSIAFTWIEYGVPELAIESLVGTVSAVT